MRKKTGEGGARSTYERALDLLSFRARTAKELRKKLIEKGEPAEAADAAIERLVANKLIDDARYAEGRARVGLTGKARSRRRIEQDLAQKGVPREVAGPAITRALEEAGTDEAAVAEQAARKKMRSLAGLDRMAQRQKLYAFLARQGHAPDAVRKAMRAVLDAPVDEVDEEG